MHYFPNLDIQKRDDGCVENFRIRINRFSDKYQKYEDLIQIVAAAILLQAIVGFALLKLVDQHVVQVRVLQLITMINLNKEIEKILNFLKKEDIKSALDLACGRGRISLPLLKNDVKIDGIDIIENRIESKNFNYIRDDVRKFQFKKKYDLIIASLFSHFFEKNESKNLIEKIIGNKKSGGFNFLICLSDEDGFSNKNNLSKFYPSLRELKEFYMGWKIIFERRGDTPIENHDSLGPHKHNLIILLMEKGKSI